MIPVIKLNQPYVNEIWKNPNDRKTLEKACGVMFLNKPYDIPVYRIDAAMWIKLDVFEGYKGIAPLSECHVYGYCNNDEALAKFLKPYVDSEDEYFVCVHLMSKDYENYYKNGSFINEDGVDTKTGYWIYEEEHPDMVGEEEYENAWLSFVIYKLVKSDETTVKEENKADNPV